MSSILPPENRRTDYVAVGNSVVGVMLLLVGVAGAGMAQVSIAAVLGLFALASVAAKLIAGRLPEV